MYIITRYLTLKNDGHQKVLVKLQSEYCATEARRYDDRWSFNVVRIVFIQKDVKTLQEKPVLFTAIRCYAGAVDYLFNITVLRYGRLNVLNKLSLQVRAVSGSW